MKKIDTLDDFNELLKKTDHNTLIVIDFYADWCGPCRMIAPKLLEFEKDYPNVIFCKVNVDDNEETAAYCKISAMPTFIFYKDGKQVGELTGANEKAIKEKVELLK